MTTRERKFVWAAAGVILTSIGMLTAAGIAAGGTFKTVSEHDRRLLAVEEITTESIRDRAGLRAENTAQHIAISGMLQAIEKRSERIEGKIDNLEARP
jgi:hypothetical protein